jgi:hypothetical protein
MTDTIKLIKINKNMTTKFRHPINAAEISKKKTIKTRTDVNLERHYN